MMHVLPCDRVREDLPAYHDGELSIDDQVLIQGHLNECVACRLEAAELAELGDTLRMVSSAITLAAPIHTAGRFTSHVLEQVRVERQLSYATRIRELFDDMHLVWAGLGATAATIICIAASAGVLQAASRERPDSLAGIISHLANPGSNTNPVLLHGYMSAPRALLDTTMPISDVDAELALAAVVTREGRVQNVSVLEEQARALNVDRDTLVAMLEAASRARFEPALSGGAPVAVSMVWLLSMTTVKGKADYDLFLVNPRQWVAPAAAMGPAALPRKPSAPVKPAPSTDELSAAHLSAI